MRSYNQHAYRHILRFMLKTMVQRRYQRLRMMRIQVGPHFGLTWTTWGVRVSISCIRVDMQTDIAPLVDIAVERALYVRLRVKVTSTVDSAIVVALNARLSIVLKGAVRTDLLQMLPDILRIIMRKVMPIEHRFDDVRPFYDDVGNRVALDTHNVEMLLVNQEDYDMLTELDVRSVEIHVVDDRSLRGHHMDVITSHSERARDWPD